MLMSLVMSSAVIMMFAVSVVVSPMLAVIGSSVRFAVNTVNVSVVVVALYIPMSCNSLFSILYPVLSWNVAVMFCCPVVVGV